ncbi:MAG: hypothetical protein MHM6MM_000231 [Cercozoa sp. M6MM]
MGECVILLRWVDDTVVGPVHLPSDRVTLQELRQHAILQHLFLAEKDWVFKLPAAGIVLTEREEELLCVWQYNETNALKPAAEGDHGAPEGTERADYGESSEHAIDINSRSSDGGDEVKQEADTPVTSNFLLRISADEADVELAATEARQPRLERRLSLHSVGSVSSTSSSSNTFVDDAQIFLERLDSDKDVVPAPENYEEELSRVRHVVPTRHDPDVEMSTIENVSVIDMRESMRTMPPEEARELLVSVYGADVSHSHILAFHNMTDFQHFWRHRQEQKLDATAPKLEPVTIAVANPDKECLLTLGRMLLLHPLTVEDVLDLLLTPAADDETAMGIALSERALSGRVMGMGEKLELFQHYAILSLRTPQGEPMVVITSQDWCLALHGNLGRSFVSEAIRRVLKQSPRRLSKPAWVAYAVLDTVIDHFFAPVESLSAETDSVGTLATMFSASEQSELLQRIAIVRRNALELKHRIWPKRSLLLNMAHKECRKKFFADIGAPFLRDAHDHVRFMMQVLDTSLQRLDIAQNTFLAKVSIEIAQQGNDMNKVMKAFNTVATIFLPLTFITGLWGMNVPVPGQQGESIDVTWFMVIVACCVVLATSLFFCFRRRRWF